MGVTPPITRTGFSVRDSAVTAGGFSGVAAAAGAGMAIVGAGAAGETAGPAAAAGLSTAALGRDAVAGLVASYCRLLSGLPARSFLEGRDAAGLPASGLLPSTFGASGLTGALGSDRVASRCGDVPRCVAGGSTPG
jgi:hypothetical protein